jgi:hypothetical protein
MRKNDSAPPSIDRQVGLALDEAKTLAVPEAGKRYFELGRNGSYEAARRGDLPVIRIGRRLRVPIVALERMLAEAGKR